MAYWFLRSAMTKYHQLGGIKQEKCIISVMEAGSWRSRCQEFWHLLRALRMNLLYVSLSQLRVVAGILGIPWLAVFQSLPSLSHGILPPCLSAHPPIRPLVLSELGSTVLQYDIILTIDICKDSIYNPVPFTSMGIRT